MAQVPDLDDDDRNARLIRNAVGVLLDRSLPLDDSATLNAWEAIRGADEELPSLGELLNRAGNRVILSQSRCDRIHCVLRAEAPTAHVVQAWDAAEAGSAIAFVPCPSLISPVATDGLARFLDRGGVLVTSDHAAELDVLHAFLPNSGRGRPGRARVELGVDALRALPMLPAVELAAGHTRLDQSIRGHTGVEIVATDALTGDPLIVLAPAGRGFILHSVPHWLQDSTSWFTAAESRPIGSTALADHFPGADRATCAGTLLSALVMSLSLRRGLALALGGASNESVESASDRMVGAIDG